MLITALLDNHVSWLVEISIFLPVQDGIWSKQEQIAISGARVKYQVPNAYSYRNSVFEKLSFLN